MHGFRALVQTVIEQISLIVKTGITTNLRNSFYNLTPVDSDWIEVELEFANKLEPKIASQIGSPRTSHTNTPLLAESHMIKLIRKKTQKFIINKIVVVSKNKGIRTIQNNFDNETLFINSKLLQNYSIPLISLPRTMIFASKQTKLKVLYLLCYMNSIQNLYLERSKFNNEFYRRYGKILSNTRGPNFIKLIENSNF